MERFNGLNINFTPKKEWYWMKRPGYCRISQNLCEHLSCSSCVYSMQNWETRAKFYKDTFAKDPVPPKMDSHRCLNVMSPGQILLLNFHLPTGDVNLLFVKIIEDACMRLLVDRHDVFVSVADLYDLEADYYVYSIDESHTDARINNALEELQKYGPKGIHKGLKLEDWAFPTARTQRLTVSQIEEKLGYPVEIVKEN